MKALTIARRRELALDVCVELTVALTGYGGGGRGRWIKTILIFSLMLATSTTVYAGDVYKCTVGGASVYQDTPCANGKKMDVAGSSASAGPNVGSLSLRDIFLKMTEANAAERRLQGEMDRDIALTKARLGSRVNDPSSNAEVTRIQNEWLPKIREASAMSESLKRELQMRCPKGASLSEGKQTCGK